MRYIKMEKDIRTLCRERPEALGLAVIVANTRGPLRGQEVLKNVVIDQTNMKRAFERLRFAVLCATNIGKDAMMALFHIVPTFSEYPPSYRRIAVVFAGHGVEGALCAHDGTVPIDEILGQFQPGNCHPSIGGIPKLFFIDACRGDLRLGMVVTERGGTVAPSRVVPQYGSNSLLAYSTVAGYKAHEVAGKGGIWMSCLSDKILQDKSILDIMTDVNGSMMEWFQDVDCQRFAQQPTCETMLNETVNLFRESQSTAAGPPPTSFPRGAGPQSAGPIPFQHSTERNSAVGGGASRGAPSSNYRKDLNEWCQQEGTEASRKFEERSTPNGHRCTITVRKRQFSSEWQGKKKDAEEEAAMRAIQWLRQQQPVSTAQISPATGPKPGKARLKEYLERHTELQMVTNYSTNAGAPFQCTLTITSPTKGQTVVIGNCCNSIREAEHDAADKALLKLERLYGP